MENAGEPDELRTFHLDVTRNFDNLKAVRENNPPASPSLYKSILKTRKRDSTILGDEILNDDFSETYYGDKTRLSRKYGGRGGVNTKESELGVSGKQYKMLRDRLRYHDDECKFRF